MTTSTRTRTRTRADRADAWPVGAAMTPQPLTIGRKEPLMKAHRLMNEQGVRHRHMARHRYGCAVVLERHRVAGIFTFTDALRLVAKLAPPAGVTRVAARRRSATSAA